MQGLQKKNVSFLLFIVIIKSGFYQSLVAHIRTKETHGKCVHEIRTQQKNVTTFFRCVVIFNIQIIYGLRDLKLNKIFSLSIYKLL